MCRGCAHGVKGSAEAEHHDEDDSYARSGAILKDAPILLLDEATRALDSESEALIQDALITLLAGRTAIVIAHRLSTVKRMDELIIIERGGVAGSSRHGPATLVYPSVS